MEHWKVDILLDDSVATDPTLSFSCHCWSRSWEEDFRFDGVEYASGAPGVDILFVRKWQAVELTDITEG